MNHLEEFLVLLGGAVILFFTAISQSLKEKIIGEIGDDGNGEKGIGDFLEKENQNN